MSTSEFNVGDVVRWSGPRKGVVTSIDFGTVAVQLGDMTWFFSHIEADRGLTLTTPVEPVIGSVVVDKDGDAFTRGDNGNWHFGGEAESPGWEWVRLNKSFGPVKVVYNYVSTYTDES